MNMEEDGDFETAKIKEEKAGELRDKVEREIRKWCGCDYSQHPEDIVKLAYIGGERVIIIPEEWMPEDWVEFGKFWKVIEKASGIKWKHWRRNVGWLGRYYYAEVEEAP